MMLGIFCLFGEVFLIERVVVLFLEKYFKLEFEGIVD